LRAVGVDFAFRRVQLWPCGFRRGPLTVDDVDLPRLCIVDDGRGLTAEPKVRDLDDRGREHRRHARVNRVATLFEDSDPACTE
jgi:hypothetical protein